MSPANNRGHSTGDGRQNVDWVQFERLMDELLPNVVPGMKGDPISRIGHFVRGVMERAKPDPDYASSHERKSANSMLFRTDVTETERFVKVRIHVPDYVDPRKLQLFINGRILKIEGPLGNKQSVSLPAPVGMKSGQAVFREGALHIRLRKRSEPAFKEVYIQFP